MLIRLEEAKDQAGVRSVNVAAFETPAEADLVDALRQQAHPLISLVAERDHAIVGHILLSPVSLYGYPDLKIMGLAPMAVLPEHQHTGIGSALVHAGLDECRRLGYGVVVVLGHPEYYPRFGFVPAVNFDIGCEYDVPPEVFMVMELKPGYLSGVSGVVSYHSVFAGV